MGGDDDLARWTDSAAADAPWWYWPGWWTAWTLMIGGGLVFFVGALWSIWAGGTLGAKVGATGAIAAGLGGIIGHLLED